MRKIGWKIKGWKKIYHANSKPREQKWLTNIKLKRLKVKIIIEDRVTFKITKGSVYQEDIILNIYEPNNEVSEYMKQKLTKLKGK